ncbi:hypothetical protein QAD02_020053 [Eretmocerus hayati]|uniref:Uncharacterized protein n=1 Tax=Eretmocerus hayati TaxID=131215 RepID=A0ACC2PLA5_9HYME|nr:hypothetical protein QAD02_020053 [Eretmocerus hayati]
MEGRNESHSMFDRSSDNPGLTSSQGNAESFPSFDISDPSSMHEDLESISCSQNDSGSTRVSYPFSSRDDSQSDSDNPCIDNWESKQNESSEQWLTRDHWQPHCYSRGSATGDATDEIYDRGTSPYMDFRAPKAGAWVPCLVKDTWYNTALGALYPGALPLERPSAFKPGALTATALRALTAATLTPKALTPTALTPGALTPGALTPGALTPGATWHLAP